MHISSLHTKSPLSKTLGLGILVYLLVIILHSITSYNVGPSELHMDWLSMIPAVIVAMIPIGIGGTALYSHPRIFITHVITAGLWILVGPLTAYWTYGGQETSYVNNLYDILFGLYVFGATLSLHLFFLSYVHRVLSAIIITLAQLAVMALPLIQTGYYFLYGTCITPSGALIIYQTNITEIFEYLTSLGAFYDTILIVFLIFALYLLFALNFSHSLLTASIRQLSKVRKGLFPCLFIGITIFISQAVVAYAFPIQLFLDTRDYFRQAALYETTHDARYQQLKVKQLAPSKTPHTIIMVIGESETRTLMNAFNPEHRQNTPWLSEQKEDPHFTLFGNTYSCVWYTVPVLEHALTESSFYNNKKFNESISILDIAKKAGYKTYWFSNQGTVGVADTPITLVAKTADVAKWTSTEEITMQQYDEALLPLLKEVDPNQNNFVVLHLMGSHIEYRNRYPYTYQHFKDDTINQETDYDNTVLYTDHVLSEIYTYAKDNLHLDALVYFSDHGTDPTVLRKPDETGFKVLRIPFFAYTSDSYIERNPDVYRTLKKNQYRFITNDLMYDFMCGILNIESNHYDPTQSMASPFYRYQLDDLVTRFGMEKVANDPEIPIQYR